MKLTISNIINLIKIRSFIIVSIFVMTLFTITLDGQNKKDSLDLIIARSILENAELTNTNNAAVNGNGLELNISKRQSLRIVKRTVNKTYGRLRILKQKPFHKVEIDGYWIVWGDRIGRLRYGGVFECIVNTRNGSIEYLIHGK